MIETAHAAGIKSQLDPYLSLALGSCAVSPLEMANSYATLARYGNYVPASSIRRIETNDGHLVRSGSAATSSNLPAEQVAQLVDVMQDVVRRGTAVQASLPGVAVAGKTGTADKGKDLWFVGFYTRYGDSCVGRQRLDEVLGAAPSPEQQVAQHSDAQSLSETREAAQM